MNINIVRWRRLAAAIAVLMLTCGTPSHAWCANLWISFDDGGGIESYTSKQLDKSGAPTPIDAEHVCRRRQVLPLTSLITFGPLSTTTEVVQFTAAQLKNLKHDPSPTPGVIITSTSTFN